MNKFGERLKELRIENNLTQRQLADVLPFSQASIARWEANLQTPTVEVAMIIAKYFNVTTDYLIGMTD